MNEKCLHHWEDSEKYPGYKVCVKCGELISYSEYWRMIDEKT